MAKAKDLNKLIKNINKWNKQYTSEEYTKEHPPTKAGFFHFTGITCDDVYNYKLREGQGKEKYKKINDAIKKSFNFIGSFYEEQLLKNKNVIGAIFLLKTTFGYRETDKDQSQTVNIVISDKNEGPNKLT